MYTVMGIRPNLVYTLKLLSQYASNLSVDHLETLKRILRYLKGTRNQRLFYSYGPIAQHHLLAHQHYLLAHQHHLSTYQLLLIPSGYTDSDFASC